MVSITNITTNALIQRANDPQLTESFCTLCQKLVTKLFRIAI
ncbi:hypothetical protein GXM_03331 [Nostoc sphaeroides CCNUC1]|uniref:Uncharacterized protein n=1 Tax=Nostoc sphaeroides CCNUC1 TaxID=2653204 RepID=A0A5P8VZK5_9NOSO|nr:hypothetical protein GXM_03331 [Nostoc sphaeroides CCNUC1]